MEKKTKVRIVISIVLLVIIAFTAMYLYQNKDSLFVSVYKITYPDRCTETFENGVLISEECTLGRQRLEEQQNETNKAQPDFQWNLNLT